MRIQHPKRIVLSKRMPCSPHLTNTIAPCHMSAKVYSARLWGIEILPMWLSVLGARLPAVDHKHNTINKGMTMNSIIIINIMTLCDPWMILYDVCVQDPICWQVMHLWNNWIVLGSHNRTCRNTPIHIKNHCSAVYRQKLNARNRQNAFIPINLSQHENSSLTTPHAALASVNNVSLQSNSHSINNLPHSIHRRRSSSPASLSPQNYSNNRQHHLQQHSIQHNGNIYKIMLSMWWIGFYWTDLFFQKFSTITTYLTVTGEILGHRQTVSIFFSIFITF